MINTNILVTALTYEQKYEKILQKKSFEIFCWKLNSPASPGESKVETDNGYSTFPPGFTYK